MKKVLRIMNQSGDTAIEFDEADAEAVALARAEFDGLMKKAGVVVAVPGDGKPGEIVRQFGDLAQENVFVPAIIGG